MASAELASESSGALITAASSFDFKHPPSCIIDGDNRSFWVTTGVFPQEVIIQLGQASIIKTVDILTTGVQEIELAKADGVNANTWETISTHKSEDTEGEFQRISFRLSTKITASYLRLKVDFFKVMIAKFVF